MDLARFWIPMPSIPDSTSKKFHGFRNPDYLTWGDSPLMRRYYSVFKLPVNGRVMFKKAGLNVDSMSSEKSSRSTHCFSLMVFMAEFWIFEKILFFLLLQQTKSVKIYLVWLTLPMVTFPNSPNSKACEGGIVSAVVISMLNCSGLRAIVYGGRGLHIPIHSREFYKSVKRAPRRKI